MQREDNNRNFNLPVSGVTLLTLTYLCRGQGIKTPSSYHSWSHTWLLLLLSYAKGIINGKEIALDLQSAMFWSPFTFVALHFCLSPLLWLTLGSHPHLQHIFKTSVMLTWEISGNSLSKPTPSPNLWLLFQRGTQVAQHGKVTSLILTLFQHPYKKGKGFGSQLPPFLYLKLICLDGSQDKGESEDIFIKNLCL